jgi:hypothetical protein
MRWVGVFLGILFFAFADLPVAAQETVPIQVRVAGIKRDDATVTVRAVGTDATKTAETDARGRAQIDVSPGRTYEVTIQVGDKKGTTYVTAEAGGPNEARLGTDGLPTAASRDDPNAPETLIKGMTDAAGACDRPRYDALRADYDRLQAELERMAKDLEAKAQEYAEATGFPPDAQQLGKRVGAVEWEASGGTGGTLTQAKKAGLPIDPAIFKLPPYLDVVLERDRVRARAQAMAAARARIPEFPKECSRSASACPEGQSGGLLAGAVNSVLGTDLAGVCDDPQHQRRDTERPAHDREHRDERD